MEVICKPKYNSIFWRKDSNDSWSYADLDDMIHEYGYEEYTTLDFAWTVKKAGTDEILYYVYFCDECEECIISVDPDPGYEYCPHCGRKVRS